MSQRPSGYPRKPNEDYDTIAWPVRALLPQLSELFDPRMFVWDPCAPRDHDSQLVTALRACGVKTIGTSQDFLTTTVAPRRVTHLITNPPYGARKRGEMAVAFIEHALKLDVPHVAMLLRVDFDSAISRQHLFRYCSGFAGKVVLLNRIKWFEGPSSPSDNHAWFMWDHSHVGPPIIRYVTRTEIEHPESRQVIVSDITYGENRGETP